MKVKQKKVFKSVTITLETEEEVKLLWHLLNMPYRPFEEYCETRGVTSDGILKSKMFSIFNSITRGLNES